MDDTDFDFLCEELPPVEAKRLRKMLVEWCAGDENSFPVQLALLTRAQWYAAAQIPVLLKQSLELLDRKLSEYRQNTATLLKGFEFAGSTKVNELKQVIDDHKQAADVILADLRANSTTAKALLGDIRDELTKGAAELERFRKEFMTERHRLEQARATYENQKDWSDWIVFLTLLLAMVAIGVLIGWKWG